MKLTGKQLLYLFVAIILIAWIVVSQIKCNKLQKEINHIRIENLEQVDSLTYINKEHLKRIDLYELEISELKSEIDSLEQVRSTIIVKRDVVVVSKSVSEASETLKHNLES